MTRKSGIECDVCGEDIEKSERRLQLRRNLLGRLVVRAYYWYTGVSRFDPDDGWTRARFDVCESCRDEIVEEVRERAAGE